MKIQSKFTLRSKGANAPTSIYLVITFGGQQIKTPIGEKVLPMHFSNGKCVVLSSNTQEVNTSLIAINKKINEIESNLYTYFSYFCANNNTFDGFKDGLSEALNITASTMAKKKTKYTTATALLNQAFFMYIDSDNMKESTKYAYKSSFARIETFFKEKTTNSIKEIKQANVDKLVQHLKESVQTAKQKAITQLFVRLVNDFLCQKEEFVSYSIKALVSPKFKDNRTKEDRKSREITEDEISALKSHTLEGKKETARLMLLLQIAVGCRKSDLVQIIEKIDLSRDTYIYKPIKTEKENQKAIIYITDDIKEYVTALRAQELVSLPNYNNIIKSVAQECGLTDKYTYIGADGKEITEQVCNAITSHWARHTFITRCLRQGIDKEKIAYMSGHSTTKMIDEVYSHLTMADKEKQVIEAMKGQTTPTIKANSNCSGNAQLEVAKSVELVDELRQVLAFFDVPSVEWVELKSIEDLYRILMYKESEIIQSGKADLKTLKALFNTSKSLKDKRDILKDILNK